MKHLSPFLCLLIFSFTDKLHRHIRVHKARSRWHKYQHVTTQQATIAAFQIDAVELGSSFAHAKALLPPNSISDNANSCAIGSSTASPPPFFLKYSPHVGNDLAAYHNGDLSSKSNSFTGTSRRYDLRTNTHSRIENGHDHPYRTSHQRVTRDKHHSILNYHLPGLSRYTNSSQPIYMSGSDEGCAPYAHRMMKMSQSGSPRLTSPPSPRSSQNFGGATPDHTPLATPAHALRPREYGITSVQLPQLRHSSLNHSHVPALVPMEPHIDHEISYVPRPITGLKIIEIISKPEGLQRKLPNPLL